MDSPSQYDWQRQPLYDGAKVMNSVWHALEPFSSCRWCSRHFLCHTLYCHGTYLLSGASSAGARGSVGQLKHRSGCLLTGSHLTQIGWLLCCVRRRTSWTSHGILLQVSLPTLALASFSCRRQSWVFRLHIDQTDRNGLPRFPG